MSVDQEVASRLRKARVAAGYEKAEDAARAMGVEPGTYRHHDNGTRGLGRDGADVRYANFFGVSLEWLRTGKGPMRRSQTPVMGYVGAGAEVHTVDPGGPLERINTSLPNDAVALVIRGESQHPLQDGWLVIYERPDYEGVPEGCLNRLCIVKVYEGPTLLKTVRRGPAAKTFNLESWNAPPREAQRLEWAAPVLAIRIR